MNQDSILKYFQNPVALIKSLMTKLFAVLLGMQPNISLAGNLKLVGFPIIEINPDAKLHIAENVLLNSSNKSYHVNMFAPVKLFADRPNAEIRIGANTRIHGSCIHAYESIVIGRNCLIAANCQIFDGNGHDLSFDNVDNRINTLGASKPIKIEDSVWIGTGAIIMGGVTIGRGAVVGANAVVTKNVPPMSVVAGNPAVVIKTY